VERTAEERTVPAPSLTRYDAPGRTRALVLVLHGGKDRSDVEVDGRSMAWRRSLGLARAVGRAVHDEGTGLWVLRYGTAGWNGDGAGRIGDARWALDQIRREHDDVPVAILGHSLGGRTACRVADDDLVRGVVALAPWLPPAEPVDSLAGSTLHAAHGRRDHITRASDTQAFVDRARSVATEASFTDMGNLGHYLLRGVPAWNAFAVDRVRRVLAL
jgi:predicted esterase